MNRNVKAVSALLGLMVWIGCNSGTSPVQTTDQAVVVLLESTLKMDPARSPNPQTHTIQYVENADGERSLVLKRGQVTVFRLKKGQSIFEILRARTEKNKLRLRKGAGGAVTTSGPLYDWAPGAPSISVTAIDPDESELSKSGSTSGGHQNNVFNNVDRIFDALDRAVQSSSRTDLLEAIRSTRNESSKGGKK